mmetsp:Transcript_50634/g.100035  ORF Transcript_50634/g.100035 Transcript_50634/m.100035 type:complete len:322 (+) Transcript_50634:26-991(+)
MEDLSITEIVRGIADESMKAQRFPLLQLLSNKVGESTEPMNNVESVGVFTIALSKMDANTDDTLIEVLLGLLTNATLSDENIASFLKFIATEKYRKQFTNGMEVFLDHNPQVETDATDDSWAHMSSVLCNLCQTDEGRTLVLQRSKNYVPRIITQIRSKSTTRRRGAVGCIRSCLFDQDIHWWMVVDLKVVDEIALPLVVGIPFTEMERKNMNPILWLQAEVPDRVYEPELDIMKMLLECIVLLCQRRGIREELRKLRVYCVVKNLDLKVEDEGISAIIYEIVNFLMGDEDQETPIDKYPDNASIAAIEDKPDAREDNARV